MDDDDQVIVVGGGLSGLTAAVTAARAGARVTVLEAAAQLGGRARTTDEGGFRFNMGPHAFYGGGAGSRVVDELGIEVPGRMPTALNHRLLRHGRMERPPYDLRGRDRRALKPLLGVLRTTPADWAGSTAAGWIEAATSPGPGRDLLEALTRTATYSCRLDEIAAPVAIDQVRRATWPGVRYLHGGWQTLVDTIADAARSAGATIRTRAKVEGLLPDGRGVQLADGEELRARTVVIAGLGPATAGRLLETAGGRSPIADPRPNEAACLDVALDRLPRRDQRFVMGVDRPLLLSEMTRAARGSAPDGGVVIQCAAYLRDGEAPDREALEHVLDLAQPGWREHVVTDRFLPRMTIHEHLGEHAARDDTGLPAVLLAGDGVGEGWLTDAALASGAAAGVAAARLESAEVPLARA